MNPEHLQLCEFVCQDLEILAEDFGSDQFQDKRIRNASSILNKLFNEGNFMKAWRFTFGSVIQPHVIAPRLEYFMEADKNKTIEHAIAGGAHLEGTFIALGMVNKGANAPNLNAGINPVEYKFKLNQYFESTGLILFGEPISRFTLIKYVANKAGGKHIDFTRGNKTEDAKFKKLDEGIDVFDIYGKNAVNVELHSIIQAVCNSKSTKLLMKRIYHITDSKEN